MKRLTPTCSSQLLIDPSAPAVLERSTLASLRTPAKELSAYLTTVYCYMKYSMRLNGNAVKNCSFGSGGSSAEETPATGQAPCWLVLPEQNPDGDKQNV